jgi:hypothetical protein
MTVWTEPVNNKIYLHIWYIKICEAMKTISQAVITIFLIVLFTNPVFGYPGYGGNTSPATAVNSTQNGQVNIDLANTTQSDQNIEISSHLIEVDADRYESQNKLYVHEMIVFRNRGEAVFSGTLKTWIPDGLEEIKVMKAQMMPETGGQPNQTAQNGNIISWQGRIEANNVLMYDLEYLLSVEPNGSIVKRKYYSKKLLYPTSINYKYIPSPGYPVLILKVSKSSDSSITLLDENRNKIVAEDFSEVDESILNRFSEIRFKELNIELSKSIDLSQIAIYLIIGLGIVIVLSYPIIRKKSPKLLEIEEKIRNSLKREPASEEQQETVEEEHAQEDEEISGKPIDELEAEKSELVAKLEELEKDYASGNLIDEEYEELKNSYQKKLKK